MLRRIATISAVFLGSALFLLLYIPVALLFCLLSLRPTLRTLPHVRTFVTTYLVYEGLGVLRLFWVWIVARNADNHTERNRLTQI